MNAQHELFKADRDQVKVFYENIFTYAYLITLDFQPEYYT